MSELADLLGAEGPWRHVAMRAFRPLGRRPANTPRNRWLLNGGDPVEAAVPEREETPAEKGFLSGSFAKLE